MTGHPDNDRLDEEHAPPAHPKRYSILHEAANTLIQNLVDQFAVERAEGVDFDTRAAVAWPGSRAVRLAPDGPGPALVFTFTSFPGVIVGFGYNGWESFPACGCDRCAEQPEQEIARMAQLVGDVITGGFSESVVRGRRVDRYECNLVGADGAVRTQLRRAMRADHPQPVGTTHWEGWSNRQP